MGLAASTIALLDHAWARVRGRLDGLTDDEYRWEPVPGCWTIRAVGWGWKVDGGASPNEEVPSELRSELPSERQAGPPPVTTIAWRMWHIGAQTVAGHSGRLFGTAPLPLRPRQWPGSADRALTAMDLAWQRFAARYRALDDAAAARPLGEAFGPYAESTVADLLLHVADEVIHHGAEVALLRDLYGAAQQPESPEPEGDGAY
jgi:hypothetical protein